MQAPSIKDVARRSGVSYKTVSRVVNGEGHVSSATRERVQDAVAELGYRPHHAARSMRSGRTQTLRLIFTHRTERFLANPFQTDLLAGVVDAATQLGYGILVELRGVGDLDEASPIRAARLGQRVDGTILLDSNPDSPHVEELITGNGPAVVVANREVHPALGWVHTAFEAGAHEAVSHLIGLGHRQIAHIADDPSLRSSVERRAGYERALGDAGIGPDPALVVLAGQMRHNGAEAVDRLVGAGVGFTALFCVNDLTALGAIESLARHALRVPLDVSVIGYDDVSFAEYAVPSLTTVHIPWYEMGATAFAMIVDALDDPATFPRGVELPVELRVRGSTGPVPS